MGALLGILFIKSPSSPIHCSSKFKNVPMPKIMHKTMEADEIAGRELVIVGDVHGCLEELKDMVAKTQTLYGSDVLYVFVGDLINKGPYNCESLHYIQTLNSVAVRGNHEERVIKEWYDVKNGTLETFTKKFLWMKGLSESDMDYLVNLPYTIRIPSLDSIIVHAGLSPWKHINHQFPQSMVTMRNIINTDILEPVEVSTGGGIPWGSTWPGPEHVYFGHDARRKLQKYAHATGLDTGCVYGGALTAINVTRPNSDFITVKAKKVHSPP